MNEATLEARLNSELERLFPTLNSLDFTYQKSFNIRLGHNSVTVNGVERGSVGGRLDILIKYKEKPLAVIELKKPNVKLDGDDVDQGISYARLLTPMPPLVIVSNGEDVLFYKSFNKEKWKPENVNDQAIQSLFKYGLSCAANEHDEAIRILLGQKNELWESVIRNYTFNKLKEYEGELIDFSSPIAKGFCLERNITYEVHNKILEKPLCTLLGEPLSGKTNVVYQLCKNSKEDIIPLYIDAYNSYGILQQIANKFARDIFKSTSVNDVRHWLINSFRKKSAKRLVIIVDNLSLSTREGVWNDINELIDINENNQSSILLVMDEVTFEKVSKIPGRPTKSFIGKSLTIEMNHMSDEEFNKAQKFFYDKLNAAFHKGALYNIEYRNPRLLRILASRLHKDNRSSHCRDLKDEKVLLPSITTFDILYNLWNDYIVDLNLQTDMRYFAKAFIKEKSIRNTDASLSIMSYGKGYITLETAESILGIDRLDRLFKQGYIQRFNNCDGKAFVLPKVPEALSAVGAFYIAEKVIDLRMQKKYEEAYEYLLSQSEYFPYGDLVAAMAVIRICQKDGEALLDIINRLIEDEPSINNERKVGTYLAHFPDVGQLKIEGELGLTISNYHPWLVLSHIATFPIGDENGNRDIHLYILAKVGTFKNILIRPDITPLKEMKGYHVHDISEDSSVLCGKVGIIEPITFAIQRAFYEMPEEMIRLCNYAKENNLVNLASRLNIAAGTTINCTDEKVDKISRLAQEITSDIIKI